MFYNNLKFWLTNHTRYGKCEKANSSHVTLSQDIDHVIYSLVSLGLHLHERNNFEIEQLFYRNILMEMRHKVKPETFNIQIPSWREIWQHQ